MNRTILIPIAGTVAVILAIVITRSTLPSRAQARPEFPVEPSHLFNEPDPDEDLPNPFRDVEREVLETVFVEEDGTFLREVPRETYKTAEELLDALAPEGGPRPTVVLIHGSDKVTRESLDAAAEKLRERCDVRIHTRAGPSGG
ncbi:MAG: hypothetical protein ACT4PV_06260 [Planctomycetaceae bacterium]